MQTTYEINSVLTMKKQHPCGGKEWKIVRVGVDIKLQCTTCGRFVNLTREQVAQRAKP